MIRSTHSANRWGNNHEKLGGSAFTCVSHGIDSELTEIRAQSPQYSRKIGRVDSRKAGAARRAVAIPALIAYLVSLSWIRLPMVQMV